MSSARNQMLVGLIECTQKMRTFILLVLFASSNASQSCKEHCKLMVSGQASTVRRPECVCHNQASLKIKVYNQVRQVAHDSAGHPFSKSNSRPPKDNFVPSSLGKSSENDFALNHSKTWLLNNNNRKKPTIRQVNIDAEELPLYIDIDIYKPSNNLGKLELVNNIPEIEKQLLECFDLHILLNSRNGGDNLNDMWDENKIKRYGNMSNTDLMFELDNKCIQLNHIINESLVGTLKSLPKKSLDKSNQNKFENIHQTEHPFLRKIQNVVNETSIKPLSKTSLVADDMSASPHKEDHEKQTYIIFPHISIKQHEFVSTITNYQLNNTSIDKITPTLITTPIHDLRNTITPFSTKLLTSEPFTSTDDSTISDNFTLLFTDLVYTTPYTKYLHTKPTFHNLNNNNMAMTDNASTEMNTIDKGLNTYNPGATGPPTQEKYNTENMSVHINTTLFHFTATTENAEYTTARVREKNISNSFDALNQEQLQFKILDQDKKLQSGNVHIYARQENHLEHNNSKNQDDLKDHLKIFAFSSSQPHISSTSDVYKDQYYGDGNNHNGTELKKDERIILNTLTAPNDIDLDYNSELQSIDNSDRRGEYKYKNLILPQIITTEFNNDTVVSDINGKEILQFKSFLDPNDSLITKLNISMLNLNAIQSTKIFNKSQNTTNLTSYDDTEEDGDIVGKLVFLFGKHYVPARFVQHSDGKIQLGIEGSTLCDRIAERGLKNSLLLTALCNCTKRLIVNKND